MYGKIRISGNILVKTGMHIGGSGAFAAIGAVDSPIIRDARTNLPMIPGSSLKGKMRSLLAKEFNERVVEPNEDHERITRLFGSSKRGNIKIIATKATHPTLIPEQIFFISFFIAYTSKNPFSRKTDTASVLCKSAIRCNEKQLIIILYNAPALPVFTPIKIPRSLLTAGDGFAVRAFG